MAPAAGSTSMGFKVYRMADTLQATVPVFCKIEFGSAATAGQPGIWLTLGTTHDGAGTIGGTILLARQDLRGGDNGATVQTANYGSADTNRITSSIFLTSAGANLFFSIERTKDSTGADTNTGLIVALNSQAGSHRHYYIPFTGTIPAVQNGYHIVLTQTTPSTLNGNVGISAVVPMGYDAKQPGINMMVCLVNDFANFALVPITVYGVSHNYQHVGSQVASMRNQGAAAVGDTNTRLLIRYE
ncbi:MAG: hypothetical protein H0U60_09830 [Blastocatellia bacterium]|nr:hypothetical protein [Blastocatellia bacterium]